MPKVTNEDNINEKLDYIGLDLKDIPEFFKKAKGIDYRPLKAYEENGYRVYRYVPISKIQILLTPMNRLNTIKEKYSKASLLKTYLNPETEEDFVKHTKFLKMLKDVKIEEIEKVACEQEKLNKQIPFKVKFEENYLWQIYYSDIDDTYFMLVPTEDLEYASFFYLLKKQIEYHKTKKEQKIFVPIAYQNYSNEYLKNSEIADTEKYLWFFTKNWSNIYDVYDKKEKLSLQIVGETIVYDNIKSVYKNKLNNKEEAIKFYKLLKALFILATELPHYYKFVAKLNRYGALEFKYENKKITYDNMFSMLADNYEKAVKEIAKLEDEKNKLEDEIEKMQVISNKKDHEYLLKEKQIATYLECRKTFFGRVKYFFKTKKMKKQEIEEISEENKNQPKISNDSNKQQNNLENAEIHISGKELKENIFNTREFNTKEFYTIEDIVKIYKELDSIMDIVKNLRMDEIALKNKIENMETKIRNANLYIDEIDKHEKSIFEFWKFANKDENLMLTQGMPSEESSNKKIEKVYNYNEDAEEIGIMLDKGQRKLLSKEEMDCIYIANTEIRNALNNIADEKILQESLSELKEEAENQRILFSTDKIDIFGGMSEDSTKIKMLGNKKHRETAKDKLKILDITKDTSLEEYKTKLNEILSTIKNSINNIKEQIGISVYIALDTKQNLQGLQACYLNPEIAISECKEDNGECILYKINLKENSKVLYFTNSIYYDNYNKTLPLGMNVEAKCLIDCNMYELKQIYKDDFRISNLMNEFKIETKKISLYEYELAEK